VNGLPYLPSWVRVLLSIRSITSTDWDDTTGRLVQLLLYAARWRCAGRSPGRAGGTRAAVVPGYSRSRAW